jgi:hypothetical protein
LKVFAIDPGNQQSAYCIVDSETLKPLEFAKVPNNELYKLIRERKFDESDRAAIEMIASYGQRVGKEVFDTCVWVGRYYETLGRKLLTPPKLIYRMEEKMHICHAADANDSSIRRALIERFATHDLRGGKGTKENRDFFYGFKADCWAAYAVALVFAETKLNEN